MDSGVPVRPSWLISYLEILQWVRGFFFFEKNMRQKCFPNHLLHSRECIPHVLGGVLHKYSFWFDCAYHRDVTLMWIFPCIFSDRANIFLPRQRTLPQTIALVLAVPNVISKIMCAREHLKSVTCTELLSGINILRVHDQYDLGRFGIISASRALEC